MPHESDCPTDSRDRRGGPVAAAEFHADLLALEASSGHGPQASFLSWLLDLPDGIDPAEAACALLDYQQQHPVPALSDALLSLLRVTKALPGPRLAPCRATARGQRADRRPV